MKRFALITLLLTAFVALAQINPGGGGSSGGGSGEANTGANVGTGVGVFAGKSGTTLNFNSLAAGSGITVVSNSSTITITATGGGGGNTFNTTQFDTNGLGEVSIINAAAVTNLINQGLLSLRTNSSSLAFAGNGDSDTGVRLLGNNSLDIVANGNAKVTVSDSAITFTAPGTFSSQTVTSSGFIQSGASGNRPAYFNGSGQIAEASNFVTAGNTGDVDVARLSLLSSSAASGVTFRSLSEGADITLDNQSTNIVVSLGSLTIQQYQYDEIMAGAWLPYPTDGATASIWTTTTNSVSRDIYTFSDGITNFVSFSLAMPPNLDSSVAPSAKIIWSTTNTSGSVVWTLDRISSGDSTDLDVAFSSASSVTNAAGAGPDLNRTTDAFTLGDTNPGDLYTMRLYREADNHDTLAGEARFIGLVLRYATTNATSDLW